MNITQVYLARVEMSEGYIGEAYVMYGVTSAAIIRELTQFSFNVSNGLQI